MNYKFEFTTQNIEDARSTRKSCTL